MRVPSLTQLAVLERTHGPGGTHRDIWGLQPGLGGGSWETSAASDEKTRLSSVLLLSRPPPAPVQTPPAAAPEEEVSDGLGLRGGSAGGHPIPQCHRVPRPGSRDGQCWPVNPLQMVCWGWCGAMSCGRAQGGGTGRSVRLQVWMAATCWCHCPMEFTLCPPRGWHWLDMGDRGPQQLPNPPSLELPGEKQSGGLGAMMG